MNSDLQIIDQLRSQLGNCMAAEKHELSKRLNGLYHRARSGKPVDRALPQLKQRIEASSLRLLSRKQNSPTITYPEQLPVSEHQQLIREAIDKQQVIIVAGETGSGKTTQLPKICLEAGRGISGLIGHTQPRRIAARSVAGRIAEELNTRIGEQVGYKVRFSDKTSPDAYIKLMTDGIILAEIQSDPLLLAYDTIIIDEAHERSLNIDFLLGYLKQLLPKRPDLKIVITSATINTARFSEFFAGAPVIEVSGRSHPVEIRYRPISGDEDDVEQSLPDAICAAVDEAGENDPFGDVLIFLPGEREIREAAATLEKHGLRNTEILPLLSRLSPAEQDRVFQPHSGRRIVLATNVAETSLTVPGIRFVIDSGLARISRYSARTKVQRLPIEPVSQASANQRAGRCGRVAAGICIRLYSEESFQTRPTQTDPEIVRTNLASVILQMSHLGLGSLDQFPFMDAPDNRAIRDGYMLLEELQAIDSGKQLTPIGLKLVRLPLDPRMARMLLGADREGSLHELLIIAAAMSVQEPRLRPMDAQQQADQKHRLLADETSDFLSYLKLWNWYHEQARHNSRNKLRKLCQNHYISWLRMREWHDLHGQLLAIVREMKMVPNQEPAKPDAIHRALLSGLLSHIGIFDDEKRNYLGARGLRFTLFPGSGLAKKPPKWVICAELVETTRLFGRTAAAIDPAWIEPLAGHLLKKEQSQPHWSSKPAQVNALEKVSLYGLPIVAQRRIHYGPIDPFISREIFIRHALVQMEFRTHGKFLAHNRRLIAELEQLEAKSRRRDLMAEEQAIFDHFDNIIPDGIYSGKLFEQWRKQAEQKVPKLLWLDKTVLLAGDSLQLDSASLPDHYRNGDLKLKFSYHFDPSHKADGITLTIPLPVLGAMDTARFEWLVPGMLIEKLTLLIKTLPKGLRKQFVPAPEFARAAAEAMPFGEGELLDQFCRQLGRMTGTTPHRTDFSPQALPAYLSMQFRIIDENGKKLAEDRDLHALQQRYSAHARDSLQAIDAVQNIEKQGITRWDFGELPKTIHQRRSGMQLQLFPALVDYGQSVAIEVFESRPEADLAMQKGLLRLFMLHLHQQVAMLKKSTPQMQQLGTRYALIGDPASIKDQLIEATFSELFMAQPWPRNESDFSQRLDQGRAHIVKQAAKLAADLADALSAYHELITQLDASRAAPLKPVIEDIRLQLSHLVYPGFIANTPSQHLTHLPRYLEAARIRLTKAGRNLKQDQQHREAITSFWQNYQERMKSPRLNETEKNSLHEFRWLIEELRVSLFAQELKTAQPVSLKKLSTLWQQLR